MKMRNLTTAALLTGGAILASQSVFGVTTYDSTPNNLLFGFQNAAGSGTEDYIINLGAASGIVGKSTVVDLSSDFSLTDFNAVLGSSSSMPGGVIGGATTSTGGNNSSTADLYATQLRSGAGNPAAAGSSAPGALSRTQDESAYSAISGTLASTTAGSGILDTTKSWESQIDPGGTGTTFRSVTGIDPDSTVSTSTVLYEDLWYTTSSSITGSKAFVYQGYFTLDLTGASPKLTFTSTNVTASLSAPAIATVSKTGSTVTVVSKNALASHSYQLQDTTSLTPPVSWANVGSAVVASGTTVTNTDSSATAADRFYRVSAQ